MRARSLAVFSLLWSACALVPLPPPRPLAPPVQPANVMMTFPTGVRVAAYQVPGLERVSVTVSYGAGSGDDPAGQEGLAHLVEHLTFRARPGAAAAPQVKTRLMGLGVTFNAFTARDNTDYVSWAPAELLGALMSLEAERLRDPLANLTDEVFRAERDVVVAELRERREEYRELEQYEWLQEVAFSGHPYGRRPSVESIQAIALEDARAFVRRHYTPANAVIVVRGPEDPEATVKAVTAALDGLATGAGTPARLPDEEHLPPVSLERVKARREVRRGLVDLPRVWLAWTVPGLARARSVQLGVLADQLTSALRKKFWDDDTVTGVGASAVELHAAGLIIATAEVSEPKHVDRVVERMKDAAHDAKVGSAEAQQAARPRAMVRLLELAESDFGSEVAAWIRSTGKGDFFAGNFAQAEYLLGHPIDDYAFTFLTRERAATLVVLPDPSALALGGAPGPRELRDDQFTDTEDLLQLGERDVRRFVHGPRLGGAERYALSNGLSVIVVERHAAPIVDVRLVVRMPLPAAQGPLLAVSTVAQVSSRYSSPDRHSDAIGARPFQESDDDRWVVGYRAASGNLLHVLDDLARWARDRPTHTEVFLALQKALGREARRHATRPRDVAALGFASALYPGHPYGAQPTEDDILGLELHDVRAWTAHHLRPDQATLLVVGDVAPGPALRARLETLFGGWKAPSAAPAAALTPTPPQPPSPTIIRVLDRPGAAQAALHVGLRTRPVAPADRASAEALAWWLSRKLERGLRDVSGASYGVHTRHAIARAAGSMIIEASVDRAVAARALRAILAEVQRVARGELTAEEAARARAQVARDYDLRFQTIGGVAAHLAEAARLDLPPAYWDELAGAYPDISAASIHQAAQRLDLDHAAVLVVGDAAQLIPQLEAAGLKVEAWQPAAPKTGTRTRPPTGT